MNVLNVDIAVIGAGTAGLAAYRAAGTHGKRAVLIEGGIGGTTCARVGCMPSKLLIAAAEAAHCVSHAEAFGVLADPPRIDGRSVMARVRSERDRFVRFVLEEVNKIPPSDRLQGYARFLDANRLQVDDHTIVHAERFVIATGSRPYFPPGLAGGAERVIVNDDLFNWKDLPDSVAVIGSGVIGLELGQALHRLGVRVTVFSRADGLAQITDPAVRDVAARIFKRELDLRQNAALIGAQREGEGVILQTRSPDGKQSSESYSYVLAATGRVPNVSLLGLENTGLALDARGVPIFDPQTMQCGDSHIFIAGDASDDGMILHEAADQGRIAGDNAGRYPEIRRGLRHVPLAIVFTDPQIATVGAAYRDLPKDKVAVAEVSFDNQGRSRVMLQNRGLLRVYGEYGTGQFVGAEMIGPRAEHLAHLLAWACQNGMTVARMLEMPFYHPVIEEGVRTALRNLKEKLLHGLPAIEHCTDCTPGV